MNSPLCSVIVPFYNSADVIVRCVESIRSQIEKNIELILVDDGSTDDGPALVQHIADSDKRIRLVSKENGGVASARNTGLREAAGKYIFFVDSDDYVTPEFCSEAVSCFRSADADMVILGFDTVFTDKNKTVHHHARRTGLITKDEAMKGMLFDGYINSLPWNKACRRELYQDISYPDGYVFEDVGTTYKLVDKADKICVSNKISYKYLIRSGSISNAWWHSDKKINDFFLMRKDQCYFICEKYPSLRKEAYSTTGFVALMGSIFLTEENTSIMVFLKEEKENLISSGFPYGILFRISYLFPNLTGKVMRMIFR